MMKILELKLTHFGKFEEQQVFFHSGINIIYGPNESGKSTIHAFICAMLYGLEKTRSRKWMGEYELRRPWTNPSWYAGMMKIEYEEKVYRIERDFSVGRQSLHIVCESQGQEIAQPQELLDRILGGASETTFRSTVFIPQGSAQTEDALWTGLQRTLVGIRDAHDTQIDTNAALDVLDRQKKQLESKRRGEKAALAEEIDRKRQELETARHVAEEVEQREHEMEEVFRGPDEPVSDQTQISDHMYLLTAVMAAAVALLLGVLAFYTQESMLCLLLWVGAAFAGLMALVIFLAGRSKKNERDERERRAERAGGRQAKHLPGQAGEGLPQKEERARLRRELALEESLRRRSQVSQKKAELEQLYRRHDRLTQTDTQLEAVQMAIDHIKGLTEEIRRESGSIFEDIASDLLDQITQGSYTALSLDENGRPRIHTPEHLLCPQQLSFATAQQVFFAVRMAAGDLMGEGELPVLLDDAFVMYDDERLEEVLRWLQKSKRQVILFTGGHREKILLQKMAES